MRLLIVGAGGHGRVVADAAEASASGWTEIAFLDDRYPDLSLSGGWKVVGTLDDLPRLVQSYEACIAATGNPRLRLDLLDRSKAAGFTIPVIVHPRATISRYSRLQPGSLVAAGGVVNIGSDVGVGCIINTGATVDHDCRLGAGVHVCPGAHLAGGVTVGTRTWFGIGAVARQGIRIGADVMVGAGAVCVEDVRDGVTVVGVPARERDIAEQTARENQDE
jgi:sugar O-acyltransferase (sialic acid O-acetyltransferase NeuD family)